MRLQTIHNPKVNFMLRKLFTLLLCTYVVGVTANCQAQANSSSITREMNKSVKRNLDRKIAEFLTNNQLHNAPFKTQVMVISATDLSLAEKQSTASGTDKPIGFIALINVHVQLSFYSKDPTLDLRLRDYIEEQLLTRYLKVNAAYRLTQQPRISVDVHFNAPFASAIDEVRRNFILLVVVVLLVVLVWLLRSPKQNNQPVSLIKPSSQTVYEPRIDIPKPTSPIVMRASATQVPKAKSSVPKQRPTAGYLAACEEILARDVDLEQGSWYLHALPEVSARRLQQAFDQMPFEEAVIMLSAMEPRYRDDIVQRLDLHPALTARIAHIHAHKMAATQAQINSDRLTLFKKFRDEVLPR